MTTWERIIRAIFAATALAAGNFIYQALNGKNWGVALERSWFQTIACFFCAFVR